MRLKIVTTLLLVVGVVLLVAWPWVVGPQPAKAESESVRLAYLLRMGVYFIATILTFFAAAVCAYLLARRTRQQFRDEAMHNVKDLIEGTLHDHRKKPE